MWCYVLQVLSRIGIECHDIETLSIKDQALSLESKLHVWLQLYLCLLHDNFDLTSFIKILGVEKMIGWALTRHFMHCAEASVNASKVVISSER